MCDVFYLIKVWCLFFAVRKHLEYNAKKNLSFLTLELFITKAMMLQSCFARNIWK